MNYKIENLVVTHMFLIFIFFSCACQSKSKDSTSSNQPTAEDNEITEQNPVKETITFFTIPFADILKNKREVPLSEFAVSVEFIQFEKTKKSLLGRVSDIQITKDYVFIKHNGIRLLTQFTRDGKFIRHVGTLGRGPKEYVLMRKFSLDEKNELVYIHTNFTRKILVYNFNGEYIKTLEFKAIEGEQVMWSRDSLFVSYRKPSLGNEPYVFMEHNENGDTLQNTANHIFWDKDEMSHLMVIMPGQNIFYRFENILHMKSMYNDTVYSYNEQDEIVPKFFIDLKKLKIPDELVYERKSTKPMPKNSYWVGVHETSNYIFIPYGYHYNIQTRKLLSEDYGCVLYNKNTKEGVAVKENKIGGFINDLSGGPDFKPTSTNDTAAFATVSALDMKLYLESEKFKNQTVKLPEQKDKLIQINKTLKEDDNHFLMVVNLK